MWFNCAVTTYRLYASTSGPPSPVAYSGSFQAGVLFYVSVGGIWFDGYWWWVCPSGQSTAEQTFALWQVWGDGEGTLIPDATVTSGELVPGEWNYVPLPAPVPLALGVCYNACTGFSDSFPDTADQFGSGQPYGSGIVSGPLVAYSALSGSEPAPFSMPQAVFGTAGTDPTVSMPAQGSGTDNFWMDVQVEDAAPPNASYRLWPNYPVPAGGGLSGDNLQQTMGTEFLLSEPCSLNNIWFYSPPGATVLPSRCAIWTVKSQAVVANTDNTSPVWSGSPGSGWVACSYSGVILRAGDYKTTVYYEGGSDFYEELEEYFGTGAGAGGITSGPLSAPNTADATAPGQTTFQEGPFSYPDTYDTDFDGQTRWVDVEVTPAPQANAGSILVLFP
jgi:hypothetical protein